MSNNNIPTSSDTDDTGAGNNPKIPQNSISGQQQPIPAQGETGSQWLTDMVRTASDRLVTARRAAKRRTDEIRGEDGEYTEAFLETSATYRKTVLTNLKKWFDGLESVRNFASSQEGMRGSLDDQEPIFPGREKDITRNRHTLNERVMFYTEADRYGDALMETQFNWVNMKKREDIIPTMGINWSIVGTSHPGKLDTVKEVHKLLIKRGFRFGLQPDGELFYGKFDERNRLTAYYYAKRREDNRFDIRHSVDEREETWKILELVTNLCEYHVDRRANVMTAVGFKPNGSFVTEDSVIDAGADLALPCFYPWFKDDIKSYFEEYMASKASVLLLLGDPGTGKSTLLRTGLATNQLRALIVTKAEIFMNPAFIPYCREMIKRKTVDVIIMEDADMYVRPRSEDNHRMAELLDITNGIDSSLNVKFIFTTNLKKIDMIDAALLRPGRAFDYLVFRHLTRSNVVTIREKLGLAPAVFPPSMPKGRKFTLADATAATEISMDTDGIIKPRF